MLNRAATYGRTDKKPFDNTLNAAAEVTRSSAVLGGAMAKEFTPCFTNANSVFESVSRFHKVMDNAALRSAQNIVSSAAIGK